MVPSRMNNIRIFHKFLSLPKKKWLQVPGAALRVKAGFVRRNVEDLGAKWTIRSVLNRISAAVSEILQFAPDSPEVPELSADNFDSFVQSRKRAFIMWYDPLCPVCRKAGVEFEKLHEEMGGSLAFGAVNATANEALAMRHGIEAFPTFRLYVCNGRCSYKHHAGGLTASEMKSFVREFSALDIRFHDLPTKPHSVNNQFPHPTASLSPVLHFKRDFSIASLPRTIKVGRTNLVITKTIMEVNSSNFTSKTKSFDSVLVYFYTTWCTRCGASLDEFIKAADRIDENVGVMALCNGEESLEIVDKYYVGKIPTLKFFRKGRYVTDYIGEIKTELLVKFMKEPHTDDDFLMMVTKHKPHGDLYTSEVFTPTQKKTLWKGKEDLIVEVTNENIDAVLKQNNSLLLLFYACWNRLCVGLKHDYIAVAKAVEKSDVVLAACDCEEHVEVADRFLITRFPTIKYLNNGTVVRDFNGHWDSDSILEFLKDPSKLQVAEAEVRKTSLRQEDEGVPDYWKGVDGGDKMLHLTDFNFQRMTDRNPAVLVMFYVTWCKSCTPLKREIGKAAVQLSRSVGVLASCDAERNNEMADKFSIIKLPTMKYFKNGTYVMDYTGRRTAEDIMAFMKDPKPTTALPPIINVKSKGAGKNLK